MHDDDARAYAAEVGVALSQMGMTPAFGTLLGWLMICDPPRQTNAQLVDATGLSKASVSTGMRALQQSGLVRRVPAAGRGHAYEIDEDAFARAADPTAKMRDFLDVVQRGIDVLGSDAAPRAQRLARTRDFYAFMIERIPELMDEFRRSRKGEV
ncbi:GbsR/MarR family transcriptional regulator [Microbacterium hominis]|uniref:MarR family transcriptional regulator n=1 Tax=Microbacterium hominis TaxID=162426 RepID=A0A7D4UCL3_9MICO|nr:MarR family transcriptional regulator [Microbacterium hominis]QKJ20903.1 MarR family transcriptional regulator [Microbacterium hominis]